MYIRVKLGVAIEKMDTQSHKILILSDVIVSFIYSPQFGIAFRM